jgi:hypothetical protein
MAKPKSQVTMGRSGDAAKHDWKLHGIKIVPRYVPPFASATEVCEAVVVRDGQEPAVMN